jgi:diacylglycerol kinase (ATP)
MRVVLILNPTSGSSSMATNQNGAEDNETAIKEALAAQGVEPEIYYTTPEDAGEGLAREAATRGAEIVIAAGGDGTLHAVASGLISTAATLAIIPMGTMNNVARSLEIPASIADACALITNGVTRRIDVGTINDHIFLEVAGIGLEATLFPAAEEIKSYGMLSTINGIFKGLDKLFAFQPTRYLISFDERRSRLYYAMQISVCNTPYYGAKLRFAPRAVIDDGLLDVLVYKNFSKLEYILHGIAISQGRRPLEPKLVQRKAKSLRIKSEQPAEVHADGVPLGHTPVTVTVKPGVLRVRVPQHVAHGPHMMNERVKETHIHRRARKNETGGITKLLEEEGPQYVK